MMERCPQCRARLKGRTICNRCDVDLRLVLATKAKAEVMARLAVQSLGSGDMVVATEQVEVARKLHATLFHQALGGFIKNLS